MGKTKKSKKDLTQDDSGESDTDNTQTETNANVVTASKEKPKKDKKKVARKVSKDTDSDDNDVEELTKNVKNLNATAATAKGKSKKKRKDESDEDEVAVSNKKPGFSLLMGDSDGDDVEPERPESEPEEIIETKPKGNKKKKTDVEEEGAKAQDGKKGKKARKKKNDSDDDIDKVLAELALEYAGVKKSESKTDAKNMAESDSLNVENDIDVEPNQENQEDIGGTVKTAAQKKKEKKERQREAALLAKQQQQQQPSNETVTEVTVEDEISIAPAAPSKKKAAAKKTKETKATEENQTVVETENAEEDNEEKSDKKEEKKGKKKAKGEKKEDEKDKKKKGVSSALVAAMQERLAKVKEEEERLKKEEELRIQREEELENMRLERLRLEAERKEKKKQKEHERKARLKAEGKLLTAKQKQDKARAQAMLESLRAQGVEVPEVGVEKRPRPGTRVRPNKKKDQLQQSISQEDTSEGGNSKDASDEVTDKTEQAEKEEEVEKVKDEWDASSSDEEPESTATGEKKVEAEQEAESEEDEEEEEESEEEEEDESDEESEEDNKTDAEIKREKAWERIMKRRAAAETKRTVDNLRAAVVCVLGHVDTGKTKILDKLRRTNVQDCEAGGITQQIGATNVPIDAIKEQTRIVKGFQDMVFKLPGLLIIDTPGHESFSNLRSRGSSLCDIAILVVDIMHGLEPQTIESINLLKSKKTPFVVALNKIDRLYNWETMIRKDIREILKNQKQNTQNQFQQRTNEVIVQFAEQGLNAALFYENPDPRTYVNLVPTSAITGEGMGNLLYLIVESCQSWLAKRLMYSEELLATVLEVKAISGLGTTIDAILINGRLREGETMVIAGTDGPIVTQIRSLLMPQPLKELRVKNAYIEHKEIIAAQGVKIAAKELEKAIAGLNLYVANKPDEIELCREEVSKELKSALSHIKLSSEGVYVQASTLGSLEALLEFLKTSKIPYANIRIGPVVKRDVMKASTMLEHESQYATILAFDVKIERDAQELADSLGVKIFQADIIYHLFDQFTAYRDELKRKKREEFKSIAVFPCKLKILPQFIFNSRDPIVMGVIVEGGIVKEGTPICVPSKEFLDIGIVTSIECNHKQVESARKGQEVCIKIEPIPGESPKMFGRHFDEKDMLTSKISRQSIDACKDYFRDDLLKADWALMVELKKLFQIL